MMLNHPEVITVIPAYNEQSFVGDIVTQARKYVDQVIIIDDGSNDSTGDAASAAGANVIRHNTEEALVLPPGLALKPPGVAFTVVKLRIKNFLTVK